MSDSVQSQSGPVYRSVVVEYRDGDKIVEASPGTPLPVTGTMTTDPETPLDVNVAEPIAISYTDGEVEVPVTPTEPLPVLVKGNSSFPEADPLPVFQPVSQGAFGDQLVANLSQEIALMFNYGVDSDIIAILTQNSGSVTASNSRMLVSTGGTANSLAVARSRDYLRYRPGYGGLVRFTLGVTTGVAGTEQTAGVGNEEDGLFFSYREYDESGVPDMCIVRRYFGAREIRYLTVTGGSTSAGNVTITLNGAAFTVAVANNSGAINQTVSDIVANFSSSAWSAHAYGNIVCFRAIEVGARGGAYSFSAGTTGSAAAVSQKVAGASASEEVIPRSSWNYDKADGTGTLPVIDWSKGNIFQIKYQWLGYGMLQFYIEAPEIGRFIRVHAIKYANTSTTPTIGNPTLPFFFYASNGSNATNISMFTASCGGFVEGSTSKSTGGNLKTYTTNGSCGSSGTLLASLLNPNNYSGKNSRIQVSVTDVSASAADAVTFRFYKNATLTGAASWTSVAANSCMFYDEGSATSSGGDLVCAIRAEHQTNNTLSARDLSLGVFSIHPGDTISVVATSDAGTVKVGCSINWIEYL